MGDRAVEMYVALKPGLKPSPQIEDKVAAAIEQLIGKIARPKNIWIVADMPEIVESIKHHVQAEKVNRGQTPRELTPADMEEIKAFGRAE